MPDNLTTVGICGAPLSGKATLLRAMSKRLNAGAPREALDDTGRLRSFEATSRERRWRFICTTGHIFYERAMIHRILDEVQVVCYVFASTGAAADVAEEDEQYQLERFYAHESEAQELGRHWTDVPWVFVLNKIDYGAKNPFLNVIPAHLRGNLTKTSAIKGKGVKALLGRIQRAGRRS